MITDNIEDFVKLKVKLVPLMGDKVEQLLKGYVVKNHYCIEIHNQNGEKMIFNGRESWTSKNKAMQSIEASFCYLYGFFKDTIPLERWHSNSKREHFNKHLDIIRKDFIKELFDSGMLKFVEIGKKDDE